MYDYLIKNSLILDGKGNVPYKGDIAIKGEDIVKISSSINETSRKTIRADGCYSSPGFIDLHAHSENYMLSEDRLGSKLAQGITLDLSGNCGIGVYPLNENRTFLLDLNNEVLGPGMRDMFSTFDEYKKIVENHKTGINVAFLQAHSPLRFYAMKDSFNREANDEEIDLMCEKLDESLSSGAFGFSSGLYYAPCFFSSEKELLKLLGVVKKHDGIFAVHHRCEGDDIIESIKHVINLARLSGVRLEISHLKAIGGRNQAKVDEVLRLIDSAKDEGIELYFDQYPYTFGSTSLFSLLPPRLLKLERSKLKAVLADERLIDEVREEIEKPKGWDSVYSLCGSENVTVTELDTNPQFKGLNLKEIGLRLNSDPVKALLFLLSEEKGNALMIDVTQTEESLVKILKHPLMAFGSDSLYSSSKPHERSYNAAIHLIKKYAYDEKVIKLEELVKKMTSEGASRLRIGARGVLEVGKKADICIFNPQKLEESYDPFPKKGIEHVFVNGNLAIENNIFVRKDLGQVLRAL